MQAEAARASMYSVDTIQEEPEQQEVRQSGGRRTLAASVSSMRESGSPRLGGMAVGSPQRQGSRTVHASAYTAGPSAGPLDEAGSIIRAPSWSPSAPPQQQSSPRSGAPARSLSRQRSSAVAGRTSAPPPEHIAAQDSVHQDEDLTHARLSHSSISLRRSLAAGASFASGRGVSGAGADAGHGRPSAISLNSPPNIRLSRGMVEPSDASVTSVQSSMWSLADQSQNGGGGGGLMTDPAHAAPRFSNSPVPQQRIRDKYGADAAPTSQHRPSASLSAVRPSGASFKSVRLSTAPQAPVQRHGSALQAARLAVASRDANKTWLEEHNEKRVSYYEPTIFALQQAGIHVEPHWFGPVQCGSDSDSRCDVFALFCVNILFQDLQAFDACDPLQT